MRAINQSMNQSCLHNGAAIKALNTEAQVSFLVSNISFVCVCFLIFKIYFIYFLTYWVLVSLCGFSLVMASGGYYSLWCVGFSLWWLLLL